MIIIMHRINTIEELKKVPCKYGVEVDIREYGNRLILNHEPHSGGDELKEYLKYFKHRFIILNIKEAGIEHEVIDLVEKSGICDYFLLDVEFPFMYRASRIGNIRKIAVRYSEAEPLELAEAQRGLMDWLWVDTITKLPLTKESYKKIKDMKYRICLVSPDRWGREKEILPTINYLKREQIIIDAVMTSREHVEMWESYGGSTEG